MRATTNLGRLLGRTTATAVALLLSLGACTSADKVPAETAVKAAETALDTVRAEAAKYVPDQLKSVEDAVKGAKASLEKKEYTAALAAAKDLPAKAKELGEAAAAKKASLTKAWEEMSGGIPQMAEAIKSRVDILSQSKKLPAGLDAAKFDGAKTGLDDLNKAWGTATESFKSGNLADAINQAKTAKDKAVEVMTALNMKVPEGVK